MIESTTCNRGGTVAKPPRSLAITAVLMAGLMFVTPATPVADAAPSSCPAYPAFPDAACTGPANGNLPLYTGSEDFRDDRAKSIENVEIRANSGIEHRRRKNVTFRNVKIVWDRRARRQPHPHPIARAQIRLFERLRSSTVEGRAQPARVTGDGSGSDRSRLRDLRRR